MTALAFIFNLLHRVARGMLSFAFRRPKRALALGAVVFLASAAGVPKLKIVLGPDELVGDDFRSGREMRLLEEEFGTSPSVLVRFRPTGPREGRPLDAADLAAIDLYFQKIQLEVSGLKSILSPFSARTSTYRDDVLLYPKLVDERRPETLARLSTTIWHGVLTDPKGADRDFLAEVFFEHEFATPESYRILRRIWESMPDRPRDLGGDWMGDLAYRENMESALGLVQLINLALLVVLILGCRYLFGTWTSGLLFAGSLVFTTTVMHGAMALAGSPIDTLSSTLFAMVTIASLEDFIFVSYARMRGAGGPRPDRVIFRSILFPGFLTSVTTFVGFLSLAVSDLSVIQRFGVWAAFGSAVEWMATFMLIPAMMEVFPKLRNWTDPSRAHGWDFLERWQHATPSRWLTLVSLAFFVAAAVSIPKLEVNDHPIKIFPEGHSFRRDIRSLTDSRGWMGGINVVFPRFDEAEMGAAEAEFARIPNVVRIVSPVRLLRDAQSGEGVAGNAGLEGLVRREMTEGKFFRSFVSEAGKAKATVYIEDMELKVLNGVIAEVNRICAPIGCYAAGSLVAYAEFSDHILETLVESLAMSLLSVCGIILALGLWLRFGWWESLVPVALSTLFGPAFMIVVQVGLGLPLNFFTSVVAGVLTGVSGDNAIQYLWAGRKAGLKDGIDDRGGGSVQCAVLMAAACALMLASPFAPARTLSVLFAIGLMAMLYGDMSLLRGMLELFKRSSGKRRSAEGPG